jgi:hypothetical protein
VSSQISQGSLHFLLKGGLFLANIHSRRKVSSQAGLSGMTLDAHAFSLLIPELASCVSIVKILNGLRLKSGIKESKSIFFAS